jgi:hypothetical protein
MQRIADDLANLDLALALAEEMISCVVALGEGALAVELTRELSGAFEQVERLDRQLDAEGASPSASLFSPAERELLRARGRRAAGRMAAAREGWDEAEPALAEALERFEARGDVARATLVRIELAGVRAGRGADPAPLAAGLPFSGAPDPAALTSGLGFDAAVNSGPLASGLDSVPPPDRAPKSPGARSISSTLASS